MMYLDEFVKQLEKACSSKTIYASGGFGQRLNDSNKARLAKMYPRNKDRDGWAEADKNTFAFDCIGLIKGVLWGWCGSALSYGGANYESNNVPDYDETKFFNTQCTSISDNFDNIEIGEMVWMTGHCGVYVGGGLVIESSPAWENGVQTTLCSFKYSEGHIRKWLKHGKLKAVQYKPIVTVKEWQLAAIADGFKFPKYGADGEWGKECEAVASKAICKKRFLIYKYKNLTKLVQKITGVLPVDGLFGNGTKNSVIVYQKQHNLIPDGEVGLNTWKKMLNV